MDTPSGGRREPQFSMGYNISLLSGESAPEMYAGVHSRPSPSTSISSNLSRGNVGLSPSCLGQRGLKRSSTDCYDQDGREMLSGSDIVDDGFSSPAPQKGSPPANGKKTKGRVKIKMEYIDNKLRRYTTFSKRKTGIMKKAYELSTLTGTQVMLLVASETGHVYTFATRKLQPMITSDAGKALIQTCLNSPDPCPSGSGGDQRMSATGFEETELSYNIADEEQKEERAGSPTISEVGSLAESSSCESPPSPPRLHDGNGRGSLRDGKRSPPSHLPPPPHQLLLRSGNDAAFSRESSGRPGGRFPVGALAPSVVYSQPHPHNQHHLPPHNQHQHSQHPASFLVSLNGAPHYLSFPLNIGPPTDLSKSSPK